MTDQQLSNITAEIVLAKNAAASATNKVTKTLTEIYNLKLSNVNINNSLTDISSQLFDISKLIENISELNLSTIDTSFSIIFSEINNLDVSFTYFKNLLLDVSSISNLFDSSFTDIINDLSGNFTEIKNNISDISNNIQTVNNNIDLSFNNLNNKLSFLYNQEIIGKNDTNYNLSLIDNNLLRTQNLEKKLNKLIQIIETKLNINIHQDLL